MDSVNFLRRLAASKRKEAARSILDREYLDAEADRLEEVASELAAYRKAVEAYVDVMRAMQQLAIEEVGE